MEERHVPIRIDPRTAPTIWTPSLGRTCGVSEYTVTLAEQFQGVRLTADAPLGITDGTLHIQHHSNLLDDLRLSAYLFDVKRSSCSLVITEHDVGETPRPWEGASDVLISLTERGREILRKKWPGIRVEWIPHGCPPWRGVQIPRAVGKTIGVFGFLNYYKGFWRLLDVLRWVPGTSLLVYSYPLKKDLEAVWQRDIEGLPVHWVRDYLPEAEVVSHIAREADIVAFLYDEVPYASASGAVRVGLSTGVPVLTSTAHWFLEFGDAVHRTEDPVQGVLRLLEDASLRRKTVEAAHAYCLDNSWPRVAWRHMELWREVSR